MNQRLIVYLGFFLLFALTAQAATYTISPTDVWEGSTNTFSLRVNNYLQTQDITDVRVIANGFSVTDAQAYRHWTKSASGSTAHWSGGRIGDETEFARFDFTAKAPSGITSAVNQSVEITGDDGTTYLTITVREDTTGPVFSITNPFDGSYFREGIVDQLITAVVDDPETGVDFVEFSYRNCALNSSTTKSLTPLNDTVTWTAHVDLSTFKEGDDLCFTFRALNNAGKESIVSGNAGFDNTPPAVLLYTPTNGSVISDYTHFTFTCTDNVAPELTYTFNVDSITTFGSSITHGINASVNMSSTNMTEGTHDITLTCTDGVGLSSSIKNTYTVDKTPPVISLINPLSPNTFLGNNQIITATATDLHGGTILSYSVDQNSSTHPEGILSFSVTAQDNAGNIAVTPFVITIDKTAPNLTILAPEEDAETDGVWMYIKVLDNFLNQSATCNVEVPTGEHNDETFLMNTPMNISVPGVPLGPVLVTITCQDQAGNTVQDIRNVLVVDRSGPFIASDATYFVRSQANNLLADIIDVSGVKNAIAKVFGSTKMMNHDTGNVYRAQITPDVSLVLGNYTLNITAEDTLGYSTSFTKSVLLIIGYDINMNIASTPTTPGSEITISGNVRYDDGTHIPENEGILTLYNKTNVTVPITTNGDFTYNTIAPSGLGDYVIRLTINSNNGYSYIEETTGRVVNSVSTSSSNSARRASPRGTPKDSSESSKGETSSETSTSTEATTSSSQPSLTPSSSKEGDSNGEETGLSSRSTSPVGVGQASGIFNLEFLKANWWVLLLLVAAIASLAALAYYKKGEGENQP